MSPREYIAPLRYVNNAEREVIPDEYLVYLIPGHSTSAHSAEDAASETGEGVTDFNFPMLTFSLEVIASSAS